MAAAEADQKKPLGNGQFGSQADIMTGGSGDLGIGTGLPGSKSGISVGVFSATNRMGIGGLNGDDPEENKANQDMFDKMFKGKGRNAGRAHPSTVRKEPREAEIKRQEKLERQRQQAKTIRLRNLGYLKQRETDCRKLKEKEKITVEFEEGNEYWFN